VTGLVEPAWSDLNTGSNAYRIPSAQPQPPHLLTLTCRQNTIWRLYGKIYYVPIYQKILTISNSTPPQVSSKLSAKIWDS